VVRALEGKHDVDVVCLSEVPHLTANVLGGFAFCLLVGEDGQGQFLVNHVNELLMGFNSSSRNDDAIGGEVGCLEFLDDVGSEVVDIAPQALDGHS
jgi:hypothetical protein